MELTNRELIDITNALQAAAEKTYPVRVAFAIGKNLKVLKAEYQDYAETKAALGKKYAKRDEKGQIIQDPQGNAAIQDGKMQEYLEELDQLLDEKVTVSFRLIDFADIESREDLTGNDLYGLQIMLTGEPE